MTAVLIVHFQIQYLNVFMHLQDLKMLSVQMNTQGKYCVYQFHTNDDLTGNG